MKARSTHIITSLLILFAINILTVWGQSTQERIAAHKQWVAEHTSKPEQLTDEQLIITVADIICGLSHEPAECKLIEACGKWDQSFVTYAEHRKKNMLDKGYDEAIAVLKRLEEVAQEKFGDSSLATAYCRFSIGSIMNEKDSEAAFNKINQCVNNYKPSNDEEYAYALLFESARLYLTRNRDMSNPLLWTEIFTLEKNVAKYYNNHAENTSVKADTYLMLARLKGGNEEYINEMCTAAVQVLSDATDVPDHVTYADDVPTNSDSYFKMAIETGKAARGEYHINNTYSQLEYGMFLLVKARTHDFYQEIRNISDYVEAYIPKGSCETCSTVMLKWYHNVFFVDNLDEIKTYRTYKNYLREFWGEKNETYAYFLDNMLDVLQIISSPDMEGILDEYLSIVNEIYPDDPLKKCLMLIIVYQDLQIIKPDPNVLTSHKEKMISLYKQHHKPDWRWLYVANQLTYLLANSENKDMSLDIRKIRLDDLKQLVGDESQIYATSLNEYANMLPLTRWQESLELYKDVYACFRKNGAATSAVKYNMAVLCGIVMEDDKAISYMEEAVEESKHEGSLVETAKIQIDLACMYKDYGKAGAEVYKPLFEKAIPVFLAGKDSLRMFNVGTFNTIAEYYRSENRFEEAIDMLFEGANLYSTHGGSDENVLAGFFKNIIYIYADEMNQYDKALEIIDSEVRRLRKNDENGNIKLIIKYLTHKFNLVYMSQNSVKIESCMAELIACSDVLSRCYGNNYYVNEEYMLPIAYVLIQGFRYALGELDRLEKLGENNADKIEENESQAKLYKAFLEHSANVKSQIKEFSPRIKNMLQTVTDEMPANVPNYEKTGLFIGLLRQWEQYYRFVERDNLKAEEYLTKAIEYARLYNNNQMIYLLSESLNFYNEQENEKKVDETLVQLEKAYKTQQLSQENSADMLAGMLMVLYKRGKYDKGITLARQYNENVKGLIGTNFDLMSQSEREEMLNRLGTGGAPLLQLLHVRPKELSAEVYDEILFQKGLLLRSSERIRRSVMNSGDKTLMALMDSVQVYKSMRAKETGIVTSSDPEAGKRMQYLVMKIEDFEHEITRNSAKYIPEKDNEVTWKQVQKALKTKEAAIEYCFSDTCVAALIIKPGLKQPEYVELAKASKLYKDIEDLTKLTSMGFSEALYSEDKVHIYERLWQPMEAVLAGCNRVYLSPTGYLTNIAFHAIKTPDGKALIDKYDICQLTSTAELARKHNSDKKLSTAAIYGGIYYDQKQASIYATATTHAETLHPAERAYDDDRGTKSEAFIYLSGTMQEISDINSIIAGSGVKTISGMSATEESFNKHDGNSPDIIHLATHGFFVKEDNVENNTFVRRFSSARYDAMLRAGLALVNANETWKRKITDDETRDGILTAKDISLLDLSNTDLMVISACETAIGIYSNEGVYGLQRGIKQAGVASMIASLWKVNDLSTAYFMSQFYGSLSKGISKRQSMKYAIQQTREKYPSPYNWAPFVMIDGL